MSEHYLLTAIGKIGPTGPRFGTYSLNDRVEGGNFSATALLKLMENKPIKIFLLLTETARNTSFVHFKKEVGDIEIVDLAIPDGTNNKEVETIVNKILSDIPTDCELTIDISQGLRHFPFLLFTISIYLQSFRHVTIKNIYYGMLEAEGNEKPFVDLKVLLDMVDWFHAVKGFSEHKRSDLLSTKLRDSIMMKRSDDLKKARGALEPLINQLKEFDAYYGAGLPLELGHSSKSLIDTFSKKKDALDPLKGGDIPLVNELLIYITDSLTGFDIDNSIKGKKWKEEYELNIKEIKRQSQIIDSYFETGSFVNAVRLMREFVVSRCMLKAEKLDWLNRDERLKIERKLSYFANLNKTNTNILGTLWDVLTQARNHIAHCGMNKDKKDLKNVIEGVKEKWELVKNNLDCDNFWDLTIQRGGGKLLITSLGLSPGLLFTALKRVEPDVCIIFTSRQVENSIDEIIIKADYAGKKHVIVIDNVHSGFNEIYQKVQQLNKEFNNNFRSADEIIVNLTGGTTTLQYAVETLSQSIDLLNDNVRKVAMIDKRDMLVQRKNPFVEGELVELKNYKELKEEFGGDVENE